VPFSLQDPVRSLPRLANIADRLRDPLILFLLVCGFYWQLVLTRQYWWFNNPDGVYQVIPWLEVQAQAWHSGTLPLWDPYQWLGQSLVGQVQPGVLYPLNWLLFALPLRDGHINLGYLNWYFVVIHYLAALTSYALCRDLKCSRIASLFGGASFALCGYLAAVSWPQMLNGAIWAPLVFLFFFRVLRGEAPVRNAAVCGAVFGFSFLSGHHQAPIFVGLALAFSWIYGLRIYRSRGRTVTGVKCAAVTFVLTGLVSAVQMLPAIEYGKHSWRWVNAAAPVDWKTKVPYTVHGHLAMPPSQIISIIFPGTGIEALAFTGCVLLALALIGIAATWHGPLSRETRVLTAIAIGSYLYSLGPFDVFHGILYSVLPMLDKARSAKLVFVTSSFALAVLGARGFDILRDHRDTILVWLVRCQRGFLLLAALAAGFAFLCLTLKLPLIVDVNVLTMVGIVAGCAGALFYAYRRDHLSPRSFSVLIVGLALLEWAIPGHAWIEARDQASLVPLLQKYEGIAGFLQTRPEPVRIHISQEAIPYNFGDWHGIDQRQGYLASVTRNVFDLVIGRPEAHPLLAVNYVIGKAPESPAQTEAFSDASGLKVYKDSSAFPRIWTVHAAVTADDQSSINQQFSKGPDHWRNTAFVSGASPKLESCAAKDSAVMEVKDTQTIRIRAEMGCTGMLILSDAFFPGWRATVDGKSTQIYRAYEALRGVVVPTGTHVISMSYRPVSFYLGLALTVLGLILTILVSVYETQWRFLSA
jgi:hypothetical protein